MGFTGVKADGAPLSFWTETPVIQHDPLRLPGFCRSL